MKQITIWLNSKKKHITIGTLIMLFFTFFGPGIVTFLTKNNGESPNIIAALVQGLTYISRYVLGIVLIIGIIACIIGLIIKATSENDE